MTTTQQHQHTASIPAPTAPYEPPTLTLLGRASDVVLGIPGGGLDADGYSPPIFEFELDGLPID